MILKKYIFLIIFVGFFINISKRDSIDGEMGILRITNRFFLKGIALNLLRIIFRLSFKISVHINLFSMKWIKLGIPLLILIIRILLENILISWTSGIILLMGIFIFYGSSL